jgi:hypothetical protein
MEDLGERVGRAIGHRGWDDGRRAKETFSVEAGKHFSGSREENGEAERKVVRRVPGVREDLTRYLEVAVADRNEDAFLVKLGYQSWY